MKNLRAFGVAALLLVVAMGCSGQIEGVIRRDAKRIQITYTGSRLSVAELTVVLPDGEQFDGRAEKFDREKEMMDRNLATRDDGSGRFDALQSFHGNSMATLAGNRGNVIKCRFKMADVIMGFPSGGAGICQISDGRVIDVFF
jgi:hypothetical protein